MPKRRGLNNDKVQRPFVGRADEIESFWSIFLHIYENDYSILAFYGVGGVGKSSLLKKLEKEVLESPWCNDTIISKSLNFDTRDSRSSLRTPERALIALRNELHQKGVKFKTFDIAFAHYWEVSHPEATLRESDVPFIEAGSSIIDLFDGSKDVIHSLEEFSKWIAGAGLLPKTIKIIAALHNAGKKWITIQQVEQLQKIGGMDIGDLSQELMYFIAYDINEYLINTNKNLLLFFDTYEALWWDDYNNRSRELWLSRDKWIRVLVTELENTMCVISGRNELRWAEVDDWGDYLKEIELKNLIDEEIDFFITSCGIQDNLIKERIKVSSDGLPFALELLVDQYEIISETRLPNVNDFLENPREIVHRFIEAVSIQEQHTLNVLSSARIWDNAIFKEMIQHFQTGYPATAIEDLSQFSFIINEGSQYRMHQLMRNELQLLLNEDVKKESHQFLFNYYSKLIDIAGSNYITPEQEFIFEESLYHKIESTSIVSATKWYKQYWSILSRNEHLSFCLDLINILIDKWRLEAGFENKEEYYLALNDKVLFLNSQGLLIEALEICDYVLIKFDEGVNINIRLRPVFLFNKGTVLNIQGHYDLALSTFEEALLFFVRFYGEINVNVALCFNGIGNAYKNKKNLSSALLYYNRSLSILTQIPEANLKDIAGAYNNLGTTHILMGSVDDALKNYEKALDIRYEILGDEHPDIATSLDNLGSLSRKSNDYSKALLYYEKALAMRRKIFINDHPDLAGSLHNLGLFHKDLNDDTKALSLLEEALEIRKSVLRKYHPHTAGTLYHIAHIYLRQLANNRILDNVDKIIQYTEDLLEHNLANSGPMDDSLIIVYTLIGELYKSKNELDTSLINFKNAFNVSEYNNDIEALALASESIAKIYFIKKNKLGTIKHILIAIDKLSKQRNINKGTIDRLTIFLKEANERL